MELETLDVTVAVLDKNGCSVISQSISGDLDDPEQSDVQIVGTVLGSITNLINGALGVDCRVFYDGQLKHPLNKEKSK